MGSSIRTFGKTFQTLCLPDLMETQRKFYDIFLQADTPANERTPDGLEGVFRDAFPIESYDGKTRLEYLEYQIGTPRYTPDECRDLRQTYGAPLKIRLRLNREHPVEEWVYLGDIPLMVGSGEFIINGVERVIVMQIQRSPGVDFFSENHTSGKTLYSCTISPERGSCVRVKVTNKDVLVIRIDDSSKISATTLLRALAAQEVTAEEGAVTKKNRLETDGDILRKFYKTTKIELTKKRIPDLAQAILVSPVVVPVRRDVIAQTGTVLTEAVCEQILAHLETARQEEELREGKKVAAKPVTLEVILPQDLHDEMILNTLKEDDSHTHGQALISLYKRLRPGSPANEEKARDFFRERFFNERNYSLGASGRFRLCRKFQMEDSGEMALTVSDFANICNYILKLRAGEGEVDDIDHLKNRRVRTICDLLRMDLHKALNRMRRGVCDKMVIMKNDGMQPHQLIDATTIGGALNNFFARGELSQVVDQSNPLAQLVHERRLSALGPGGLNRKRAGFDVRDVHTSHYGRVCPVETPEGANIGLIVSLGNYSSINELGFLITPYYVVKDKKITSEVVYLRADEERDHYIGQADIKVNDKGEILTDRCICRHNEEFEICDASKITLLDVAPNQLVGVAASLIPFLEHDDANRALMGSNMQRQAVPLVIPDVPLVGTGMEADVVRNSSMVVRAKEAGTVTYADALEIRVSSKQLPEGERTYRLHKFKSLNEGTTLNQTPLVRVGDTVKEGEPLTEGAATRDGHLALGKNVLMAFLSWEGCNFEDSILVSEELIRDDAFTSVHIEEYSVKISETMVDSEEITRDIPGVSEAALSALDTDGLVTIGRRVKPGDILVGKIKKKRNFSTEEKLLRAIFGRQSEDDKNISLVVSPGTEGYVIDVKRFTRRTPSTEDERKAQKREIERIETETRRKVVEEVKMKFARLKTLLGDDPANRRTGKVLRVLKDKDYKWFVELQEQAQASDLDLPASKCRQGLAICLEHDRRIAFLKSRQEAQVGRLKRGDELRPGVRELVKVYVAVKRKLSVGDKMAGRHGNKGVVSRILPIEDMPFLADGTPIQMVLNPLGVPSRMNVGQILEVHLGWAAKTLGFRAVTPVFDGASERQVIEILKEAGLPEDGKAVLYDGRTGEAFHETVTVGYMYFLKLHHLVAAKIHARATGPYSLITQQPLDGKARNGGQRFGEMEVWALEAYGAATILQEMLTVKSDDVEGRTKIYESMVKGENAVEPGIPASFDVLCNEVKALGINIKLNSDERSGNGKHSYINEYNRISINLASPNDIRSWSNGEVKTRETINYRSYRPEKGGLFCEKIFGPVRDWECSCGKFNGIKYNNIICDRCGVKITHSKVRRSRMGHINLAAPVVHTWLFRTMVSHLSILLDIKSTALKQIIYFKHYVITDPGNTGLKSGKLLSQEQYRECCDEYGSAFTAQMGAEAIRELIRNLDIQALESKLRKELSTCKQKLKTESLVKRLRIVQSLLRSRNSPAWMTMDVIPVIPPDLRPLVLLDSGNFAASDLNDLYGRVIYCNNRLSNLIENNAPDIIVRNEKRMLQLAVDSLFDNSGCERPEQGAGNRPLKSLTDMIKGKQGRFRANLLGKRVDYSARSVIIVGPELHLDQVGLPKKIALELFQPFIIHKLKERGLADTIKSAKTMLERKDEKIWDVLEEVIEEHPVLLNRAPTLHRMGIQAFYPVLVEGDAIRIHPLVCAGFNADFDGDQMAVHLPLTVEATAEASMLMISTANIFSPAHGNPIITADLDIVLGCYYLTLPRENAPGEGKVFRDFEEVLLAYDEGRIHLGTKIKVRPPESLIERDANGEPVLDENGQPAYRVQAETNEDRVLENGLLPTTAGRILFYDMLPRGMMFYNRTMNKKSLNNVVSDCHLTLGRAATVRLLDSMKKTGFHYATLSGVSFSAADLVAPTGKTDIIKEAEGKVANIEDAYQMGDITDGERYNQIVDIWTHVTEEITNELLKDLKANTSRFGKPYLNPVWAMFDSKARGSTTQIRQLAGFRGLMTKPNGKIIETPIRANFREGLRGLEYFSSTHGARKGLADTALKTADSGYLTRKLVEVAQDMTILSRDCGTHAGISKGAVTSGEHVEVTMADNIFGRISAERIRNPVTDEIIVDAGDLITRERAQKIEELDLGKIRVRSPLTCELDDGICANCYGMDLSTREMVETGLAVGIIAAQSIGEPGTQLTMRTFHIGGVAATRRMDNELRADVAGAVKFLNLRTVRKTQKGKAVDVVLNRNGAIVICDEQCRELSEPLDVIGGATLLVKEGDQVKARQPLASWDAFNTPLLTEKGGIIRFEDVIEGQTMRVETDASGFPRKIISEHKGELHPQVIITDKNGVIQAYYSIPEKAHLQVDEGDEVSPGDILARTPREMGGTQDITGGLPRVTELFEARKPKDPAVMAEVDGEVELGDRRRGKRIILIKDDKGDVHEHLVPQGKHVRVHTGDRVRAGESLVDGPLVPHDILRIKGEEALQEYLLNEVQKVYRAQNVRINDKHIEILVRQMLNKVQVTEPGDTDFLITDAVSKPVFHKENERVIARGGKPATCVPILQGIARASLSSDSVIAAVSFQETTKVLTDAAIAGREDHLRGLKENVLIGRMIPAGTGSPELRRSNIRFADGETAPQMEEVEPEDELGMDLEKAVNPP